MTFSGLPNMLSTGRLVFSLLAPRNAMEGGLLVHRKLTYPRQETIWRQAWEHGGSTDRGCGVYEPRPCHTDGRHQEGPGRHPIKPSLQTSLGVPRRPHRPLWGSNVIGHRSSSSVSVPRPAFTHLPYGTRAGCGLCSSRVLVGFQLLSAHSLALVQRWELHFL